MADDQFFARYPGDMTDDDRGALEQAGFELFEDSSKHDHEGEFFAPRAGEPRPFVTQQVVRITADGEDAARRRLIEALGREPADLTVTPAAAAAGRDERTRRRAL